MLCSLPQFYDNSYAARLDQLLEVLHGEEFQLLSSIFVNETHTVGFEHKIEYKYSGQQLQDIHAMMVKTEANPNALANNPLVNKLLSLQKRKSLARLSYLPFLPWHLDSVMPRVSPSPSPISPPSFSAVRRRNW